MFIKNMKKETHKKLLEYLIKRCDKFLLFEYYILRKCKKEKEDNIIDIIESNSKYSKEVILSNYSDSLLDDIYNLFKDNLDIFNNDYVNKVEKQLVIDYHIRKDIIHSAIANFTYQYNVEHFINKYKDNIIKKLKYNENIQTPNSRWESLYVFSINENIIKALKDRNLFEWEYPNSLEDLCFIKNDYYKFSSISHEELYDIYCENEGEYEYLKSIGVEFYEEHLVKEDKFFWNS